jgi:hypothetical protein
MYDYKKLVFNLRNPDELEILPEDLLERCIIYKSFYSSNTYSLRLENDLKNIFNLKNKLDKTSGDATTTSGKTVEIKVSLGNLDFNFVQIRPNHKVDYYILLIYDISVDEIGKIHFLFFKSHELYNLIPKFGEYSHGTIKVLGRITQTFNKRLEYSLRPSRNTRKKKRFELWKEFLEYEKTEEEIFEILNT